MLQENPYYGFSASLPLAGYYVRFYMRSDQAEKGFRRAICVYNESLEYVGESQLGGLINKTVGLGDSASGITTFDLSKNKNNIIICRVNF